MWKFFKNVKAMSKMQIKHQTNVETMGKCNKIPNLPTGIVLEYLNGNSPLKYFLNIWFYCQDWNVVFAQELALCPWFPEGSC